MGRVHQFSLEYLRTRLCASDTVHPRGARELLCKKTNSKSYRVFELSSLYPVHQRVYSAVELTALNTEYVLPYCIRPLNMKHNHANSRVKF